MSDRRERNRAETVRMRRRQHTQKRLTQASAPPAAVSLEARPLPPVTSRHAMTYVAPQKSPSPNTRRRFQAALSLPGIEVRMPSISFPRAEIKWRVMSLLLSFLLAACLYLSWTLPTFRVAAAQVHGNQKVSADAINSVLDVGGQPIFTLMPAVLEARLRLNYPELASAGVTVALPNVVDVEVAERKPVILWQQGGAYTWIDDAGVAFRPNGSADNLIQVAAQAAPPPGTAAENDPLSPLPYLSPDMVSAIKTLAPDVPQGTTLVYSPTYGLGWSDSRGWQVFFGSDAQNMPLNLQVYKSLVASLTQQEINPAFISVQYANAPYYRMSQ